MEIAGTNGNAIEVSVVGYQFPDASDLRQRFSWHMVAGRATQADVSWRFRWQALSCDESPRVGAWLRSFAAALAAAPEADVRYPSRLAFTEPNLAFSVANVGRRALLRVELDLEFHRDRANWRAGEPYVLDLEVTSKQVVEAAAQWDEEIAQYPGRALQG